MLYILYFIHVIQEYIVRQYIFTFLFRTYILLMVLYIYMQYSYNYAKKFNIYKIPQKNIYDPHQFIKIQPPSDKLFCSINLSERLQSETYENRNFETRGQNLDNSSFFSFGTGHPDCVCHWPLSSSNHGTVVSLTVKVLSLECFIILC